jgi:hypothetical protein
MVISQFHTQFPGNIWYIYYNTGYFVNAAVRTLMHDGFFHLTQFVGSFGWLYVQLPRWAVVLYAGLLFYAGLTSLGKLRLSCLQRSILSGVLLLGSGSCILAMWLQTPEFYIQNAILHNMGNLYGIQGRHFIPFVFAGMISLANRFVSISLKWSVPLALIVVTVVNASALVAIRQAYYP